jgi:hypothetical protein
VGSLIEELTRGNPTEVKVVLASVALALACYQLVLIAVGYGKLRPRFLQAGPAAKAHRASGDAIAVLLVVVAAMCIGLFGFEDDATLHIVAGSGVLAVLALKIAVLRRFGSLGRYLPVIGTSLFLLLVLTWATSAGGFLADA